MNYASDLSKSLNKNLKSIEELTNQTAVHRKKFEFALSQIKKFTNKYCKRVKNNKKFTQEEQNAASSILFHLSELQIVMSDYLLEKWTNSTLDNPSDSVLIHLQSLFTNLKEKASIISPSCSKYILPNSAEWNQYHILDLRAISASFTQYLNSKKIDPTKSNHETNEVDDKMRQRLLSIQKSTTIMNKESDSTTKINESKSTEYMESRSFSPIPVNYRKWLVNIEDFEKQNVIGSGVSATVYRGIDKRTKSEVAIKEFKTAKMNGNNLQAFQREVAVLATVNHPTLLKLVGATDTLPFCIITEWMPQGSLFRSLHEFVLVDPTQKTIAAFDIARGMQYLHNHHIVHRDLKSLNVLMDNDLHIRICDFAFSRHATDEQTMTSNIGTPHWMAPEILYSHQNYTAKVDVYAYGILLWELVTAQVPYFGLSTKAIMFEVRDKDIRPNLPSSDQVNPSLRDLITQCWDRNPDNRPSFDEIVRRFIDDKVRIDGTNEKEFDEYIKTSSTISEIVNKKVQEVFNRAVVKREISLGAAVRKIKKMGGVPIELIDKLWLPQIVLPQIVVDKLSNENESENSKELFENVVVNEEKSDEEDEDDNELSKNSGVDSSNNKNELIVSDEDAAQYLLLFKKTSKIGEAARVLRKMKNGAIPHDVMCEFIEEVPTGSIEVDADIVAAACKNGCADFASLYASKDSDISLALLVCARNGVDVTLKAAVTDLCVTCLAANKVCDETSESTNDDQSTSNDQNINNDETTNNDDESINNAEKINNDQNTNNDGKTNTDENINNDQNNNNAEKINDDQKTNNDEKINNAEKNNNNNQNTLNDENSTNNSSNNTNNNGNNEPTQNDSPSSSKSVTDSTCSSSTCHFPKLSLTATNAEKHLNLNTSANSFSGSSNPSSTDSYITSSTLVSSCLDLVDESDVLSMKNAAALLCLVGIGNLERITQLIRKSSTNFLLKFLNSKDRSLMNAAMVASLALAKQGKLFCLNNFDVKCDVKNNQNENEGQREVDKIFETMLEMIENEPLAASAVVNIVCKQAYYAEKLIIKISQNCSDEISENALKALIASAKIKELRSKIKDTLQKCKFKQELKNQVQRFLSLI